MQCVSKTIVTQPASEPLELVDAKEFLRVSTTDDNTLLTDLLKSIRMSVENYLGRALITQTWNAYFDKFPADGDFFELPWPPLQSVTHIKYTNYAGTQSTLAATVYAVDAEKEPGRIMLKYNQTWPSDELYVVNPIEIQFVCGYAVEASPAEDVPEDIITMMKLALERIYDRPDSNYDRLLKNAFEWLGGSYKPIGV